MKEYPIHEFAKIFPMMPDDQIQELAEDIRENGQENPATIDEEGYLLDGRNRAVACRIAGVEMVTKLFAGRDEDKLNFVISQNFRRRQLTESQRAMTADKLRDMFAALAKARQEATQPKKGQQVGQVVANFPPPDAGKTRDQAGKAMNVSGRLVDDARKVRTKGTPELVAKVESGEVKVSRAAKIADLPKEQQVAALEAAPTRTKKPAIPDLWFCLVNGDPLSASDIYVNRYDADEPVTGDLVFASAQDAIDEGQKHYDMEDLKAVTVSDFLKESAGL